MKITVTADDICKGAKNDGGKCPIALAIKRITGKEKVDVGADDIECVLIGNGRYFLPEDAIHFYQNFDNDDVVEPFEFDLADEPDSYEDESFLGEEGE